MGCCYGTAKTFVEDSIKEFWLQNPIMDYTCALFVDLFEKSAAYKKDLRSPEGFADNILRKLFAKNKKENDYMINEFLEINSTRGYCIPAALLFLMKSNDPKDLVECYCRLMNITKGRIDNPMKIKNNQKGLKQILIIYVCLISLFSFDTIIQNTGRKNEEGVNVFYAIYSLENIERNITRLFSFEYIEDSKETGDNYEKINIEVNRANIEMSIFIPQDINNFFARNYENFRMENVLNKLFELGENDVKVNKPPIIEGIPKQKLSENTGNGNTRSTTLLPKRNSNVEMKVDSNQKETLERNTTYKQKRRNFE